MAPVVISALDAAQSHAADDELGQQQVDDDDRQNGDGYHHVHLAHIELQKVRAAQLGDQDGQGLFVGGVQYKRRNEVVVPACHEGEDSLHSQRRLHDGQHDLIKGIKFACAVNAGSLHDLHGKGGIQILLHEEEHGGCRNAGNDQRDEAVFQPHLGDQLQKAQCGHLCGHGHDEQNQSKGGLFELEVIGVDAVSRQCREVNAERCRAGGHQQAVADTAHHGDVGIRKHVAEVCDDGLARHKREPLLDLEMGAGGVDDQHIEEEQAQKADQHQHQIAPCTAGGQDRLFGLVFRRMCHTYFPPLAAAFLVAFSSLRCAFVRPSSSLVSEKYTMTHSTAHTRNSTTDTAPAMP